MAEYPPRQKDQLRRDAETYAGHQLERKNESDPIAVMRGNRPPLGQAGVEEIIVTDDGSTDATLAILRSHAAADRRLKILVNETRLGVVRNFEKAIRLVRCPWVALADQDDVWVPDKLARLCEAWDGTAVLLHHATHKFSGKVPGALRSPAGERRKFTGDDVRRLLYRNSIVGHTTLVRADVAKKLTPFPRDVPHDWWIGVGAAVLGSVQYVDEFLVCYRIHAHNAYHPAGSRFRRLREEHELRLNLLAALGRLPGLRDDARTFAENYRTLLKERELGPFSWRLWRFYRRHAWLLFGSVRAQPSRFTCWRKSFGATLSATAWRLARDGAPAEMRGPSSLDPVR